MKKTIGLLLLGTFLTGCYTNSLTMVGTATGVASGKLSETATSTTIIVVIIIDGKEIQALLIATKDGEIRIIIIIIILQKNLLNSYGDKMLTQQVDGVARIQGLPLTLVAV